MGTNITYRGVEFKNVLSKVSQTPVRDASGTDRMFNKWTIEMSTVIAARANNSAYPYDIGHSPVGAHPVDTISGIRCRLGEDRGDFSMVVDGHILITANAATDQDSGPKVTHLNLTQLTAGAIRIEWGIEFAKTCCATAGDNVLNHRWSVVDDVDQNFRTTRIIRGVIRVRGSTANPADFRGLAFPALPDGWRRHNSNFVVNVNGRELGYEVRDEEVVGRMAPRPATRMSGVHSETILQGNALSIGKINVRLEAPGDVPKRTLIERGLQIVTNKLAIKKEQTNSILLSLTLIDVIEESANAIEIAAEVQHLADRSGQDIGSIAVGLVADKLNIKNYDNKAAFRGPYGTAGASLASAFQCFLQDPCAAHPIPGGTIGGGGVGVAAAGGAKKKKDRTTKGNSGSDSDAKFQYGDASKFEPTSYTKEHEQAIYRSYQIDSIIEEIGGRIPLPIAKSSNDAGDTVYMGRLHKATAKRIVRIKGERIGRWPEMLKKEDFETGGFRHMFLNRHINARARQQTADGKSFLHAIDIEYVYQLNRAPNDDEAIPVGILPWETSRSDSDIPANTLKAPADVIGASA